MNYLQRKRFRLLEEAKNFDLSESEMKLVDVLAKEELKKILGTLLNKGE